MKRSTMVLVASLCLASSSCKLLAESGRGDAMAKVAPVIEKDVHAANEKLKELAETLQAANERLGKKEYPADLATKLAGFLVPFDSDQLDHRELTDFPRATVRALLRYTMGVQQVNESRDKLKSLLVMAQPPVERAFKEEKEPVVGYSVIFRPEGAKGVMAELVPNKDPFKLDGDLPSEYVVIKLEMSDGRLRTTERKAKRWQRGDLTGSDPVAIPVHPQTTAVFAERTVAQLRVKLLEQIELLTGKDKDLPTGTPGLIQDGAALEAELKKIASSL